MEVNRAARKRQERVPPEKSMGVRALVWEAAWGERTGRGGGVDVMGEEVMSALPPESTGEVV